MRWEQRDQQYSAHIGSPAACLADGFSQVRTGIVREQTWPGRQATRLGRSVGTMVHRLLQYWDFTM